MHKAHKSLRPFFLSKKFMLFKNEKTFNSLHKTRFYVFLSHYPFNTLHTSLAKILEFQIQNDKELHGFYKRLRERRKLVGAERDKKEIYKFPSGKSEGFFEKYIGREILYSWGLGRHSALTNFYSFPSGRVPLIKNRFVNLLKLPKKNYYKKNNFNFFQPRIYLKHQILSSEYRTVNFFDKFLLSDFLLSPIVDYPTALGVQRSKSFSVYFFAKKLSRTSADKVKVRLFKSSNKPYFGLNTQNVAKNVQKKIPMSESFSFSDKLSERSRNFHFSYLLNKRFDFFEFFRDFWI
jgi:hypothetical protein